MKSWCVLTSEDNSDHYNQVSSYLNSAAVPNKLEYIKINADEFGPKLKEVSEKFEFVLIGSDFLESVSAVIPKNYVDIESLNSVDGIVKEKDGATWPVQFLDQAMVNFVSNECRDVGVTNPGFVIGSGGLARAVISGMVKSGFTTIVVADTHVDKTRKMVEGLQKLFFNLTISVCSKEQITLLSGVHSLCVNTVSIFDDLDLFKELFYCNFIKRGGVVLDLNRHPIETPLLKLSKGIAGKLFSGHLFWAYHDGEWIKNIFNHSLDISAHSEELKKIFSKRTFDESKLSQILDL